VVPPALAGERIDRVVAMITGRPRAEAAALVEAGSVRIDGQEVSTRSRKLAAGQVIEIEFGPAAVAVSGVTADAAVAFEVVVEDPDFVVVDKPPGLVVHPGAGNAAGTLVNGLLARYPEIGGVGAPERPGIVHRLDAGTSGLMVVARTAAAYEQLVAQLAAREVRREYLALVLGHVEAGAGIVDAPIGRSRRDRTRMAVAVSGREARTGYEVRARFDRPVPVTELVCRLETGRTHQIRVHLAAIGHPVVGDARYGGDRPALGLSRPYLHAHRLSFEHPTRVGHVEAVSELPADLHAVRDHLA